MAIFLKKVSLGHISNCDAIASDCDTHWGHRIVLLHLRANVGLRKNFSNEGTRCITLLATTISVLIISNIKCQSNAWFGLRAHQGSSTLRMRNRLRHFHGAAGRRQYEGGVADAHEIIGSHSQIDLIR